MEQDLLQRDVCDLIEESAVECTLDVSQKLVQMASSPKAHACVQGVVERRFYPIHIRDLYSVMNLLLLQLFMLRPRAETSDAGNIPSVCDAERMKKRILELEREVKENKKRYKELFKINQQWAKDYAELNKKLEDNHIIPVEKTPSGFSCDQCVQSSNELDEKTELIKDINKNYEKLKLIQNDLEKRLDEAEQEKQKVKDQCKALSLQLEELGGMSTALRHREERRGLIEEVHRLREKVLTVERERAKIQTQLNRLRLSLRQMMIESDVRPSVYQHPQSNTYNTPFGYPLPHGQSWHSPVFTDSAGHSTSGSKPNGTCGVSPRQYAPITATWRQLPTGYRDQGVPQTPPGYLSRGDMFEDELDDNDPYIQKKSHLYKPEPSDCTDITELKESPKYLELPSRNGGDPQQLPSPLSVPRPLSAPGSLLDSTSPHINKFHSVGMPSPYHFDQEKQKNGLPPRSTINGHSSYSHHGSNPNLPLYKQSHKFELFSRQNGFESIGGGGNQENYFVCPYCSAKFDRTQSNYDTWFDHVAECTS